MHQPERRLSHPILSLDPVLRQGSDQGTHLPHVQLQVSIPRSIVLFLCQSVPVLMSQCVRMQHAACVRHEEQEKTVLTTRCSSFSYQLLQTTSSETRICETRVSRICASGSQLKSRHTIPLLNRLILTCSPFVRYFMKPICIH